MWAGGGMKEEEEEEEMDTSTRVEHAYPSPAPPRVLSSSAVIPLACATP